MDWNSASSYDGFGEKDEIPLVIRHKEEAADLKMIRDEEEHLVEDSLRLCLLQESLMQDSCHDEEGVNFFAAITTAIVIITATIIGVNTSFNLEEA